MIEITERLQRRIRRDFPDAKVAEEVESSLRLMVWKLGPDGMMGVGQERLMAAVVMYARGDVRQLRETASLERIDWRDLLVATRLADRDFPQYLDQELP
ncbi:hypothetical protein ABZY45_07795 [Streptomyces sp. NPDC006516]|uniref:hypothetical protein n=1 Tax=Streptomyces sp. NPDC006516 TaxID=3154309 RepID=UPI0033A5E365